VKDLAEYIMSFSQWSIKFNSTSKVRTLEINPAALGFGASLIMLSIAAIKYSWILLTQ